VRALEQLVKNASTAPLVAGAYVSSISVEQAILFCSSLELGSDVWVSAFLGLRSHPKTAVIGYVKQVSTSAIPSVRYWCYCLCESMRWHELIATATKDRGNDTTVTYTGSPTSETVGKAATLYLKRVCGFRSNR
jgi:hypothetical protein